MIDADKIFREAVDGPPPPPIDDEDDGDHHGDGCHHGVMLMIAGSTIVTSAGGTFLLFWGLVTTLFTLWNIGAWLIDLLALFGWLNGAREALSGFLWFFIGYVVATLALAAWQHWRGRRVD